MSKLTLHCYLEKPNNVLGESLLCNDLLLNVVKVESPISLRIFGVLLRKFRNREEIFSSLKSNYQINDYFKNVD
jgi:hypothetical protein